MRLLPRLLGQTYRTTGSGICARPFASVPEATEGVATAESISVGRGAPTLVQLPQRVWGSLPGLPADYVSQLLGNQPEWLGVVRSAFAAHDEEAHTLRSSIAMLSNGAVAVAARHATPAERLVVDEYVQLENGTYALQQTATELFRLLKEEDLRVAFVPNVEPHTLQALNSPQAAEKGLRQSTNNVLMVAPTAFGFNDQAAQDNHFMHAGAGSGVAAPGQAPSVTRTVLREFAGLHHQLTEVAGVNVHLFQHDLSHGTPDAVFPNNWFSTHPEGEAQGGVKQSTLVYYPMKCPNRQKERRPEMKGVLQARGYDATIDMTQAETSGVHLEGTGAFVLDRINGVAYVALSERANRQLAESWVDTLGYKELVTFSATDAAGKPVYHTNVMMAIGTDFAVVCLESVADDKERQHLHSKLSQHHQAGPMLAVPAQAVMQVVDISRAQMDALCGNCLELEDGRGLPILALSSRAYEALTKAQRTQLLQHVADLVHAPIHTLEHIGGGGVRCALAELF